MQEESVFNGITVSNLVLFSKSILGLIFAFISI